MTNGNEKGARFTRDVCKKLERWAGTGFKPRPTIVEPIDGWAVKGDVACNASARFPFSVECKCIEGWELDGLYEQRKWPVWGWWEQCVRQADAGKSIHPLLIFSRNRRKTYVLARQRTVEWLKPQPEYGPIVNVSTPERGRLAFLLLDDLVRTRIPRS
jgi:hypothetical protein